MNLILISIDNLRYDCVGYQSDKKELEKYNALKLLKTPTLDSVSEKSICFTQCISTNTYTTSAHASVLTGIYPPRHGVRAFFGTKLNKDVHTLPEVLRVYGYDTVLSTDVIELFAPLDLHRGFEHTFFLDDHNLFSFLEKNKGNKLFLFMHIFDVHEPYLLTKYEFKGGCNNDYFAEMEKLHRLFGVHPDASYNRPYKLWGDFWAKAGRRQIEYALPMFVKGVSKFDRGRFNWMLSCLEKTGIMDDALLVISSDHGEGRCYQNEPSFFLHAGGLFDNVIRVPLIIRHKDIGFKTEDSLVSLVDIFPTMLSAATGESAEDILSYRLDGTDLFNPVKKEFVYSETWTLGGKVPIIDLDGAKHERFVGGYWDTIPSSVHQRGMRTKDRKIVIRGRTDEKPDRIFMNPSNAEYIKNLYTYLFDREIDKEGFAHFLNELNTGSLKREDIYIHLINSSEYKKQKAQPALMIYDLKNDPHENHPAVFLRDELQRLLENKERDKETHITPPAADIFSRMDSINDILSNINAELADMAIKRKINFTGMNNIDFYINKIKEIESVAVATEKIFGDGAGKKQDAGKSALLPGMDLTTMD